MSVIPFSQALRERTWSGHGDSEGADFMTNLMRGTGTREDYIALVAQHYFVYQALEAAAAVFEDDPEVEPFLSPPSRACRRSSWTWSSCSARTGASRSPRCPPRCAYVERIRRISAERWAGGFVAHHYTRYLGDLSGGQHICRLMQRHFGFETNGVGFYLFDQIADPAEFKNHYRAELDATGWDEAERERVIDEVLLAYRFNTELFVDLSRAKAAA